MPDHDPEPDMYRIVYANGTYALTSLPGAQVTTLAGPVEHDAVKKADASGKSTNTVGWRVKGGTASCVVNGTAVQSFDKAITVGPDKLASTDGIFGIRLTHNVDLTVSGMGMVKAK